MESVRVVLLSREGCHLCDDARAVVARVCADLGVAWREDDITRSPELLRRHVDDIPVTFIDGAVHDFWRVDETRLRAALLG
ncbi:MAG: hypothetical protein QOF82_1360 [Frankiales bacterium]|jgi:hypothetical protein|nr:hypothetical protein [Frankiales bacterium]MDX6212273.1 hypothetical protein [Frankiales bacterium]MDX6222408.1 hypothetical protein [Frankiales bacterium]